MNPIKLTKILLLSILAIFLLPVHNIFAQTTEIKTIENPKCSQLSFCPQKYSTYNLGFPYNFQNISPQGKIEFKKTTDAICQEIFSNTGAIATEHKYITDQTILLKTPVVFFMYGKTEKNFGTPSQQNPTPPFEYIKCSVPVSTISGCTNPEATNYNNQATEDDGTCILPPPPPPKIPGCTNSNALNYNPDATEDNGTCIEKIEGCTDSTAINYNPLANVHKESSCQYPPIYTPQNITGAFEKSQVSIGATTWTLRFTLNVSDAVLDPSTVQTWDHFTAISATTSDKTITLTLRQFDDQRLDVECTNYEVTIPRHALTTTQGDTNANPISGNFEVVGCEKTTDPQDSNPQNQDEENKPKYENTIKQDNFYLSLYDTDEKGKIYININNTIYILGLIVFFLIIFFVLFGFIKNSFLGKQKR